MTRLPSCSKIDTNTKLKLYVVLLPIFAVLLWLFQVGTGAILSRESAAFLSSFTVVTTVVAFFALVCTFILTGTLILVGHADARGDLKQVGKLVVWSSVFGFIAGGASGLYVFLDADTLLETFDPKGQLVNETKATLQLFTLGFPFLVYCYGLAASLFALLHIGPIVVCLVFVAAVFVFVSYGLFFSGEGLQAFGYGFDIATVTFAFAISIYIYGSKERRTRYQFPVCSGSGVVSAESDAEANEREVDEDDNASVLSFIEKTFRQTLVEFLTSFGMLSLRSLCLNCQKLVSSVLLVRIGVVEAAVYVLLGNLRSIMGNVTTICTFVINFVGSRVYGAGDADHKDSDFRGFLAISKFSTIFTSLLGCLFAVIYGSIGRDLIVSQAADNEKAQFEALLTTPLMLLFASFQISTATGPVLESVLLTAKDFNYVGASVVFSFCVGYVPLLVKGYEQESLTIIYAGDVVLYWLRTIFAGIRWFWFKKPKLIAKSGVEPEEVAADAPLKEKVARWLCCGHGLRDWHAIVHALTREEDSSKHRESDSATPPPEL